MPSKIGGLAELEKIVLTVHRRNGGLLTKLEPHWRLLEPELLLDSMDLAEIMVAIEKMSGIAPFEAPQPPRTWEDIWRLLG
jgi:hypothetical protein